MLALFLSAPEISHFLLYELFTVLTTKLSQVKAVIFFTTCTDHPYEASQYDSNIPKCSGSKSPQKFNAI